MLPIMTQYTTRDIRNITLVGAAGTGKTTVAERILELTKTIGRMGSVEEKNTACDFEPEEKEHGHSLSTALLHADHNNKRINLIDTPGYPGFLGQAIASLAAVETACVVVDAGKGIEDLTRRMMINAKKEELARAVIINKIDHGADNAENLLNQIRETFGSECIPFNLPAGGGASVVSCFPDDPGGETDFSTTAEANSNLVEQIVEVDDHLMEKYLEDGEVSSEELIKTFTRAMAEGHLVPIFFMSAKEGSGANDFTSAVADYFPTPGQAGRGRFLVTAAESEEPTQWKPDPDPEKPFVGHVFRLATDAFVGKLAIFKVHQGTLKSGDTVQIDDIKKGVRLSHFFQLQGKEHVEADTAIPGDLIAVAKIDEMHYDAVVHTDLNVANIKARPLPLPKAMFGLAVTATKRGDEGKIAQSFMRLADEDPTFTLVRDPATHETVIRGNSDMHLRIMLERLKNRFGLEVQTAAPKIAYKETISAKAEGHHRHKKQSGGAGQFGEVYLRIESLPRDGEEKFVFVDDTFGGSVPKQFMPAIEKGIKQALADGCIAGYPMEFVKVSVYDGKHHPVDSKEVAFVTAGKKAFIDAVNKAKPALLEPIVIMEITAPQDYMGDITADISGRRGRVQGSDILPGGQCIITVLAPLGEVMTYANALKAMTQGTGSYTMEYSHDDPCPAGIQAEVVKQYKPKAEDD